jgi:ribosomal protein S27E
MPVLCPKCQSDQITANRKGVNVKRAVVGGLLLGPFGLAFGAKDRNKVMVTCLACGHTWTAGEPNPPYHVVFHPNSAGVSEGNRGATEEKRSGPYPTLEKAIFAKNDRTPWIDYVAVKVIDEAGRIHWERAAGHHVAGS